MRVTLCLAVAAAIARSGAAQEPAAELPAVEAARVVLEARILDGAGRSVAGLTPADLRLQVDGRPLPIETVVWVAEGRSPEAPEPATGPPRRKAAERERGRLVVLLFQKDFDGSRLRGLLRSLGQAEALLEPLTPKDRVAILSFDARLRLHLDFTGDREAARRVLDGSVLLRWPTPLEAAPPPSLAALLPESAARRAASPEQALLVLGEALRAIPGAKTVLFFGWGLGELSGGVFRSRPEYDEARRALERARAAVFCLDVTDAAWHSLETGLQQLAFDTGGQYLRVYENPANALGRVAAALDGHYVIGFEPPRGTRGEHRVRLSLARRRGTVLTRTRYVD
jgi:VWFA-related protein